jgi:hypothetical protein
MPKVTDKPTDIMDEKNIDTDNPPQTEEQEALAMRVQRLFTGSFNAKVQLDLPNKWAMFDDYIRSVMNEPQSPDHPGSKTQIIKPIIDSQISDIVDKPFAIEAQGREPGDHMYAQDVEHLLEFVLDKNGFETKLTQSERDRLELGTTIIKVYTDQDALGGKGLPTFEIVSPANFFPDPKWTAARLLQEGEFHIHAVPRPLSWFRKTYPKMGKYVTRQVSVPYDPDLQTDNFKTDEVQPDTSMKALAIECYMKDANGELYCVHVANNILLEDSRDLKSESTIYKDKKVQRRNLFPFVAIPCYTMRGTGWGQGDVEILIPTQDMINEMDDQIRMAARMMGNPQIAVGMNAGKGFDTRKWTNAAGLRVPLRDVNAFKVITPVPVSRDVVERREKGFEEANIISGRPDVNRGESPGQGITAASAIIALQQAGQKVVLQKSKTWKEGWGLVLDLLYDEIMTHWDEPMWVRVNGTQPDFHFIDPSQLSQAPVMVPNINPAEGQDSIKPLLDDPQPIMGEDNKPQMNEPMTMMNDNNEPMLDGKQQPMMHPPTPMMAQPRPMTRDAEFDLKLSIGDGLPTDTSFQFQMMSEWGKMVIEGKPVISWTEFRNFIRNKLGMDLGDDSAIQPPMPQGGAMPGAMPNMPSGPPMQPQLQAVPGGMPA